MLAESDADLQRMEVALCARDILHWFTSWVYIYDPWALAAGRDPVQPFDLFPNQERFVSWLQGREREQSSGVVVKSRESGGTFVCAAYALHGWLFRSRATFGFGAANLDLVDKSGDPGSIFWKLRFMLSQLPRWMMPAGWSDREHSAYCRLENPENGSVIVGDGGANMFRGSRLTMAFIDEAAFLPFADATEASVSQATRVRIDISTPHGPAGPFYRKAHDGTTPRFDFRWEDDPRKSREWYDAERARIKSPVVIAQELDRDFSASISGICIRAEWVRAAVNCSLRWADGEPYSPRGPLVAGLDLGETSNTLVLRQGAHVRPVDQWAGPVSEAIWRAIQLCERAGCDLLCYDSQGPGSQVPDALRDGRQTRVRVVPVNGGAPVPETIILPDGRKACEQYANTRAYVWDCVLAGRLRHTFEYASRQSFPTGEGQEGAENPKRLKNPRGGNFETAKIAGPVGKADGNRFQPDEMLVLPDDPQLSVELSIPLLKSNTRGKTLIEGKAEMSVRGVASPHRADALSLTFAPVPRRAITAPNDDLYTTESLP